MKCPTFKHDSCSGPDHGRRRLLGGMLSAYTITLIPWAVSLPVHAQSEGSFLALSAILVGREALDTELATRYYDALSANDPEFPSKVTALLNLINTQHIDPLQLQKTLDEQHQDLATVPRQIVTAWYAGVVAESTGAICLAYELALMSVVTEDKLRPPTYAYGAYGSWQKKP